MKSEVKPLDWKQIALAVIIMMGVPAVVSFDIWILRPLSHYIEARAEQLRCAP